MQEKYIENSIRINAGPEIIWETLVKPEYTRKYMFGCEAVSDWKPGSSLLWKGEYQGSEMVFVKGSVIEIDPPRKLVYTVFDPNNSGIQDIPENYLTVTYFLEKQGQETVLKVRQGDYLRVAQGEKRYVESYNNGEGWNPILVQIKALAEEQKAIA